MVEHHQRYIVIGTTGCGKSTLAQRLALKLGVDCIELDELYWRKNWTPADPEEFCALVDRATQSSGWVMAGNYHQSRSIAWPRAQAIVFLDYSFWTIFSRLSLRTLRRCLLKQELWGGNYESLGSQLKLWSDQSILNWFFKTYWRRKKETPLLLGAPENRHLRVLHFKTPAQTETWISGMSSVI